MRILVLSFYFEPDLCAGSFRNTPLVEQISKEIPENSEIIVITTQPNRYKTYTVTAPSFEERGNIKIHRIDIPTHNSGMKDQINSFYTYYKKAIKISKQYHFDLVYASSSRLFTGYLGRRISLKRKVPFYLDVRDIFVDTMENILTNKLLRITAIPVLKFIESKTFKNATHINLISEGFHPYFKKKYDKPQYSFFSNGIDAVFLEDNQFKKKQTDFYTILYAGNIGEGQGLEKILPPLAKKLGRKYQFQIYGDGGSRTKLENQIDVFGVQNITINKPVSRDNLLRIYKTADYLFLHLNSFKAFEKVLPSKLFEYGAYDIPVIAGVAGFAKKFINKNMQNAFVFEPCNYEECSEMLLNYEYKIEKRTTFIKRFKRSTINNKMAKSIINLIKD